MACVCEPALVLRDAATRLLRVRASRQLCGPHPEEAEGRLEGWGREARSLLQAGALTAWDAVALAQRAGDAGWPRVVGRAAFGGLPVVKRNAIIPRPRDRLSSAGSRRCFTSWIPQAAGGKAGLFMARSLVTDSSAETEPRTLSSRWLYGRQHSAGPNRSIASPPRSLNIATALHAEAISHSRMRGMGWGFAYPAVLQRMGRERLQHGVSCVGYPTIRAMNSAESRRL